MKEIYPQINNIIQRSSSIKSFRCKSVDEINFSAGQFMRVSLPINGKEETKSITISNSPTEKGYYEFTKKISESNFSLALNDLKIGDNVHVKLPYGSFVLNQHEKKIAFLCGGIGITPIRSMCKYLLDIKSDAEIILIYGNHTEEDIIFKEDINGFQKNFKNFKVVYTLDSVDNIQKWQGRLGFIDEQMIKEEIPDYEESFFYICGPKEMVSSMENLLKDLKIDNDKIIKEKFM